MSKFSLTLSVVIAFIAVAGVAHGQSLDSEQSAFLVLINNYRAQNGVGPLSLSPSLQNSAQWMSQDMAAKNYLSHTDSLGRDPFTRMAAFGYTHYPEGENIAAGNSTAQNTLTQWQTACDPDLQGNCTYAHRQNMLSAGYKAIGIGRAAGGTYGWYWTTDFGGLVESGSQGSAPTINSFSAAPPTIGLGQSSTLSWSVSGATSITIDNGVGNVSSANSQSVQPTKTTTYKMTATNSNGTVTAVTTVTVNAGDTQPPTAPAITSAQPRNSTEVDLAWSASIDNVGVTAYRITRNGFLIAAVSPNVLSYADVNVVPNGTYVYSVTAYDAAGNFASSGAVQVVTPPSPNPTPAAQSLLLVGGSGQAAAVNAAFGAPLQVKVLDQSSNPMAGVNVTFSVPATGAGATFFGSGSVAIVMTNAGGIATSPALLANNTAGTYSATAAVPGLAPVTFSLTNTASNGPPPSVNGVSIWSSAISPRFLSDGNPVELGVKFRSDVAGAITAIRFFKGIHDNGTHTGSLWTSSGALLATGAFSNETDYGWQTLTLSAPVLIGAHTTYIASYHTTSTSYAVSFGYFQTQGVDNTPLHALQSGVDGANGVLMYGPGGAFPQALYSNGDNYWVDVVFNSSGGSTPPSTPTPTSLSIVGGSGQSAAVTTAFGSPLQVKVLDQSSSPMAGVSVMFTAPASGASAAFSGSNNTVAAMTNASGIATSPVLSANSTAGAYSIIAAVQGLQPATFSLTNTSSGGTPPPGGNSLSIWSNQMIAPRFITDGNPVELGVKFRSDVSGVIAGIRFYKGGRDNGIHTGSLWTSNGTRLATGIFSNESDSGWQTLTFSPPVPISANTTYVASYHTTSTTYAISLGYFQSQGAGSSPLHALQSGVDGPNGVLMSSPGGLFPLGTSFTGDNYWVDVVFDH